MRISCFLNSMQRYIENRVWQNGFISVYSTFTTVHRTFTFKRKTGM